MRGTPLPTPGHEFLYTRRDFQQARERLYKRTGISLSESKDQLVYSRLARRLRSLHLHSFVDYFDYLDAHGEEWQQFVNALTTNLTSFFRERHHFDSLAELARQRRNSPLRLWSAAASSGEEAY